MKNIEMLNFYRNLEKVSFKNYIIDDNKNLNLLFVLYQLHEKLSAHDLDFKITGVWALILESKKIYRTVNDLDIIILQKNFKKYLEVLKNDFLFLSDPNLDPKEFLIKSLNKKTTKLFRFRNIEYQNILDLILTQNIDNRLTKVSNISNFKIKYRLPLKFLMPSNSDYFYKRNIDSDDNEFYSRYIKN
jgi:hypothetical protein